MLFLFLLPANELQAQFTGGDGRGDAMGRLGETVDKNGEDIPETIQLLQNYPNPFNPSTQLRFSIPEETHVHLAVYNLIGRQLKILVNDTRKAGWYDVTFDATGFSSGVFFYRLEAGHHVRTRPMTYVK